MTGVLVHKNGTLVTAAIFDADRPTQTTIIDSFRAATHATAQ
jgi:hypothetical protein